MNAFAYRNAAPIRAQNLSENTRNLQFLCKTTTIETNTDYAVVPIINQESVFAHQYRAIVANAIKEEHSDRSELVFMEFDNPMGFPAINQESLHLMAKSRIGEIQATENYEFVPPNPKVNGYYWPVEHASKDWKQWEVIAAFTKKCLPDTLFTTIPLTEDTHFKYPYTELIDRLLKPSVSWFCLYKSCVRISPKELHIGTSGRLAVENSMLVPFNVNYMITQSVSNHVAGISGGLKIPRLSDPAIPNFTEQRTRMQPQQRPQPQEQPQEQPRPQQQEQPRPQPRQWLRMVPPPKPEDMLEIAHMKESYADRQMPDALRDLIDCYTSQFPAADESSTPQRQHDLDDLFTPVTYPARPVNGEIAPIRRPEMENLYTRPVQLQPEKQKQTRGSACMALFDAPTTNVVERIPDGATSSREPATADAIRALQEQVAAISSALARINKM